MNLKLIFVAWLLITSCTTEQPVTIEFAPYLHGKLANCKESFRSVGMTDLRFYIHDMYLVSTDDKLLPLTFEKDGRWQSSNVALVDLENGSGACFNGTSGSNAVVEGTYPGGLVKGLEFKIGVPETLNHIDPLTAVSPLNYTDMHWHWASGYKFFRAGLVTLNDSFFIHLGSSRCSGRIGDIKGCLSGNRPFVHIGGFDPTRNVVGVDLGLLFNEVSLNDGINSDCQSGPVDPNCEKPFRRFGLNFETGKAVESANFFSSEPKK